MKAGQYSEEKIIAVLKQADAGIKVTDLCREHGISDVTFYRWKSKYAGLELNELRRLKALEDENGKLKHLVAEKELDIQALKAVVAKKW